MIRDLSLAEMEFVSGGDAPPGPGPRDGETLQQQLQREQREQMLSSLGIWGAGEGSSEGGDQVVSTGTRRSGFWGRVFNALDVNGDGDLYDEAAIGLGAIGAVLGLGALAVTSPVWGSVLLFSGAVAGVAGGLSAYMDSNPQFRIW